MTREEAVHDIIEGTGLIGSEHPYKDDILFFKMLEESAVEKEWFELCNLCVIQIRHLENKQNVEKLMKDIDILNEAYKKLNEAHKKL